ncbi:MAG TPA: SDR family NAD(P)-dependent oxidoreductase, partial [Chloroflexota bacterium]
MRLQDRVAIVTGGSRGIGRAIAQRFAAEGATVVIAARDPATLEQTAATIQEAGGRVLVLPTDVSDEAACDRLIQATVEQFGGVDILINNAAIASPQRRPFQELPTAIWQQTLDVNLGGLFY